MLAAHLVDIVKGIRLSEIAMYIVLLVHDIQTHIQTCKRCFFKWKGCVDYWYTSIYR